MTLERTDPAPLGRQCVLCARHTCKRLDPHPHQPHQRCTPTCPCTEHGCTRRDAAATLQCCRRCYTRLEHQLNEIPELYALAAAEMHPGGSTGGGRSTEPSLGIRVAALDFRSGADVFTELGRIDGLLRHHTGEPQVDWTVLSHHKSDRVGRTIVDLCASVNARLHTAARTYPHLRDLARDLNHLHHTARTAARTIGRHHQVVDCPADSIHGICGARIPITGQTLDDVVHCPRCATHWEVKRLLLVAQSDQAAGVWLAPEDASVLLNVPTRTLRQWAKEGKVQRSHGLYEVGSIKDAIQAGGRRDPAAI